MPSLKAQADQIDMEELSKSIDRMVRRARVLSHAFDVMDAGSHTHPMQAFLHATECFAINDDTLSDSEFYALLPLWGRLCEGAQRANTATPVGEQQAQSAIGLDAFAQRFMRGE
jgi:hypothetical protein